MRCCENSGNTAVGNTQETKGEKRLLVRYVLDSGQFGKAVTLERTRSQISGHTQGNTQQETKRICAAVKNWDTQQ